MLKMSHCNAIHTSDNALLPRQHGFHVIFIDDDRVQWCQYVICLKTGSVTLPYYSTQDVENSVSFNAWLKPVEHIRSLLLKHICVFTNPIYIDSVVSYYSSDILKLSPPSGIPPSHFFITEGHFTCPSLPLNLPPTSSISLASIALLSLLFPSSSLYLNQQTFYLSSPSPPLLLSFPLLLISPPSPLILTYPSLPVPLPLSPLLPTLPAPLSLS